jgi:hypothetical protein
LLAHGGDSATTRAAVEAACDDALHPLTGETRRHAMAAIAPGAGVALEGAGLAVSAVTQARQGGWTVLRAVNTTDAAVRGGWRLGTPVRDARLARLDETPGRAVRVARDGRVNFTAPPHAVITMLVR